MNVRAWRRSIFQPRHSGEHDGIAARHPCGITLIAIARGYLLWGATLGRHYEDLPWSSWTRSHECNLGSIRRPMRHVGLHGGVGELNPGTSVGLAPPQSEVGVGDVSDPLAVTLEVGLARRNAGKVNRKLLRLAVQAHQIEATLLADYEQLLTIRAGSGIAEQERSHGQLHRLSTRPAEKRSAFTAGPDILGMITGRFKEEVFSIRRPGSAKLFRRLVPVRQHGMQPLPVGRNLPQR